MNLRDISRRVKSVSLGLTLLLCASASAQTVDNNPDVKAEILDSISKTIKSSAYVPGVDFDKLPQYLADAKPKLDAANNDEEFVRVVNEVLRKFGTTHLDLLSPRRDNTVFTGSVVGVGITVTPNEDKSLLIIRTVKDAPAERAGIVPGDSIVEVDGVKIQGTSASIMGKEGSDVDLTVRHADGAQEHYILTRRAYSTARPETLDWVDKDTAKLTVYSFDYSYDADNVEKLMQEANTAKHLILDLRDNGGGAVVNMKHLLGMLIPEDKPVGVFIDRRLVSRYLKQTKGHADDLSAMARWSDRKELPRPNKRVPVFKGSIVVLINGGSGSASEIAAAALKDDVNATIIGSKSAGAVLVSMVAPATNGFGLQFPLCDFVTCKGVRLEGKGVVPDLSVDEPRYRLPNDKDVCLDKAIAYLSQNTKTSN